MQHHVGRRQYAEPWVRLETYRRIQQFRCVNAQVIGVRQNVVVDVELGLALRVNQRRQLVKPAASVQLLVRRLFCYNPAMFMERFFDLPQPLFWNEKVEITVQPALRGIQSRHRVGCSLEQDDGRFDAGEGTLESIQLPANLAIVRLCECACGFKLRSNFFREPKAFGLQAESGQKMSGARDAQQRVPLPQLQGCHSLRLAQDLQE